MSRSVAILGTRGYPSYYGGFETAVRKLAPFLADSGWKVYVYGRRNAIVDADPFRDHRIHSIQSLGIEKKAVSTLSYGLTAAIDTMRKRPDAVVVMNVANGFWLPLLKLRGIRTAVNVDGVEWEREKWGGLAKFIFKTGAKFTARFADELITDARALQERWLHDFNRQSTYIPYGGDVPKPLPLENGLEHRKYILVVARFVPENTVEEFFQAVEQMSGRYPIVLVGSSGYGGPLDKKAADLARNIENVTWLGHVSDDRRLFALWQHAGVYFHGHSVGGTNPAAVQAMACGAPVVARDTSYNREVFGDVAHYVPPVPSRIAESILDLMADGNEQERQASGGIARAKRDFTWTGVCAKYEELLRMLILKNNE